MKKLLSARKGAVAKRETLSDAMLIRLAVPEQDSALAAQELAAAHGLLTMVVKAQRESLSMGKESVAASPLATAIERAKQHSKAAARRIEKAAADFSAISQHVIQDERGVSLFIELKKNYTKLFELDLLIDSVKKTAKKQRPTQPKESASIKSKRWTREAILSKARATGLKVVKSKKDNHVTIWSSIGGIGLWEDGTATRADVPADLAVNMTLREAAEFLFPDER